MQKLTDKDPETQSADLVAGNIALLQSLFPETFIEGKVDFEILKQLLGGAVDDREEKYGLNWHGKRRARQIALTPSTGTLRPCPEDSVDWDTTQNLMIEGDNLEVLKLLQKSYAGKVKLIYIDPPYNTGKDFVYPDNFQDNIKNYLDLTGQVEGGKKISSNTEASGRFHTDWLNMMYPRLKLARNLLRDDGVVFISIDDNELINLKQLANDVFGEENFVGIFPWKRRTGANDSKSFYVSADHEYLLVFAKSAQFEFLGVEKNLSNYTNPDNDPRGPWARDNLTCNKTAEERPNLFYPITDPESEIVFQCNPNRVWAYEPERMKRIIAEGKVIFPTNPNGTPMYKRHLAELRSNKKPLSTWILTTSESANEQDDALNMRFPLNSNATKQLRALMGSQCFNFPKSNVMIQEIISQTSEGSDLVCDFFAGSGTTGHAVMAQNATDNAKRRYILIQLPEPLDSDNKDQKTASDFCDQIGKPRTIAELTKERLLRAGRKIKDENPIFKGDTGFRVFKLDSSNIHAWEPNRDDLADTLLQHSEHLKTDRTEQDILFELLLKLGLDLTVPIEQKNIFGKTVHSIGAGTLLTCLAPQISNDEAEFLALGIVEWHKQLSPAGETQVVFRDSAFADDVGKTNLTAILQQNGLENVRSL